jgi:uncharacterized protein (TIGR02001 family)
MKPRITLLGKVTLAAFLFLFAANAWAQATVGADLAYKSMYVWRGMTFYNESPVFWPDVWVSYRGLTVTAFSSMALTSDFQPNGQINEMDYYIDYSRTLGPVNASLGYAHYTYPNTTFLTTGEIYAKVGHDFKIVQGLLAANLDVMEAKGLYAMAKVSKALPVKVVVPTLNLSLGYCTADHNAYYMGVDKGGPMDFTGTLGLVYSPPGTLGKYMSVVGDLNYSTLLTKEVADAALHSDQFYFGLGLSFFYTPGGAE